ncbi:MAG: hypothetical protein HYU88_03060 [Chloroflexi bacterium]|nr:hypothetical protein [Chloroflexota bacterium]MBI4504012.1 hypothetical protein [Chloroflexota bacterium]
MPEWLPFVVLGLLLLALPVATLLVARGGTSEGALRAAALIAATEGLVILGAAVWLSHPGEPLFWILVLLALAEIVAVLRMWRTAARRPR